MDLRGEPYSPGQTLYLYYRLKNTSADRIDVPPDPSPATGIDGSSSDGASSGGSAAGGSYGVGEVRVWVERQGADPIIPGLPPTTESGGRRYLLFGGPVPWAPTIAAGEERLFFWYHKCEGFPPGRYHCEVEYLSNRGKTLQVRRLRFEVEE